MQTYNCDDVPPKYRYFCYLLISTPKVNFPVKHERLQKNPAKIPARLKGDLRLNRMNKQILDPKEQEKVWVLRFLLTTKKVGQTVTFPFLSKHVHITLLINDKSWSATQSLDFESQTQKLVPAIQTTNGPNWTYQTCAVSNTPCRQRFFSLLQLVYASHCPKIPLCWSRSPQFFCFQSKAEKRALDLCNLRSSFAGFIK